MKNHTKNGHNVQINKRVVPATDEEGNPTTVALYDWDITVSPGKVIRTGTAASPDEAKSAAFALIPDEEQ